MTLLEADDVLDKRDPRDTLDEEALTGCSPEAISSSFFSFDFSSSGVFFSDVGGFADTTAAAKSNRGNEETAGSTLG